MFLLALIPPLTINVLTIQSGHIIGKGQPPSFDYKKYIDIAVVGAGTPVDLLPAAAAAAVTVPAKSVNTFTIDEDF